MTRHPAEPETLFTFTGAAPENPAPPAPKPKHGRRYRPPGPPFNDKLYAQNGRQIGVCLEVPGPDEECPLTLSPMSEDCLDFLQPTTTWFSAFPSVRKMTLPCGHSFGALNLLYHFARRNMLCPCCRAGLNSPLTIQSVPAHFRMIFSSKVSSELSADNEEVSSDNARAAAALQGEDSPMTLVFSLEPVDYITSGITMSMEFYGRNSDIPRGAIVVPMLPTWQTMRHIFDYQLGNGMGHRRGRRDGGGGGGGGAQARSAPDAGGAQVPDVNSPRPRNVFIIPSGHVRSLLDDQLSNPNIHEIAISAIFEGPSTPQQGQVARTERVVLNRTENRTVRTLDAGNGSLFTLETLRGDSEVADLTWAIPDDYLLNEAFS
jgi:hypothetical protein